MLHRVPIPSRAMAVALLALVVSVTGTAYAANPSLFLDQANTATAPTTLSASTTSWPSTGSQQLLNLTNNNTTSGATALGLKVGSGHAPLTVNSATKVTNLNADKLDNLDSSQLQRRVSPSCGGGAAMTAIAASGTPTCAPFTNMQ